MSPGRQVEAGVLESGLLEAIRRVSGHQGARWATPPKQLRGGYFATIFRVRLADAPGLEGDLVARVLPTPETWQREITAQSLASSQGFPTPTVRLGSLPTPEFDRAWILMDFAEGSPPLAAATAGAFLRALPRRLWRTPRMLADALVRLHAVDVRGEEIKFGRPGVAGTSLEWLYSDASRLGSPALMVRAERLMATRPPYTGAVLCHGDMHPINILRGPESEAVIDWTYATYDDPLYDVAVTRMILWDLPVKSSWILRPAIRAAGHLMARRFVARYESRSGVAIDPKRLAWFSRLAALRILAGVEDWRNGRAFGRPADHPFYLLASRLEEHPE